jgi:FMN phosphatase YigB (HAD superfamily)
LSLLILRKSSLEKLQLAAKQAIFVDDRQLNNDAAEACGIRSILFTSTSNFIKDFETLIAAGAATLS